MQHSLLSYFTDAILRGPTLASMLMGLCSSLIGVLVFFQRRALIGEVLSHTSYPGVILGVVIGMLFFPEGDSLGALSTLACAFITGLIALFAIEGIIKKGKVNEDSALCFILSSFFGFGVLASSFLQQSFPQWYRVAQSYLFGQAATMTDHHILLYLFFACGVTLICVLFYPYFQVKLFDPTYAQSIGMGGKRFQLFFSCLVTLSVVIGLRSVGVVLMSSMLIAPAVFATAVSRRFAHCLISAACFGMLSAFLGVVLSLELPAKLHIFALPTGPFIVIVSGLLSLFALLISAFFRRKKQKMRMAL